MTAGYAARIHVNDGQLEVTVCCLIDGIEHYVTCPIGDGMYFAQRAVELAFDFARAGGMGPKLAEAVLTDERNHGGLLGRETFKLAAVVKRG